MSENKNISKTIKDKEFEFQHLTSEIGQLAIKHYQDGAKATEELLHQKIEKAISVENEILNLNQKVGLE